MEIDGRVVGELHLHWKQEDREEADGANRAYLSALRLRPDLRGRGYGTRLIEQAIERIRSRGFTEVTIGAYADEARTQQFYRRCGFNQSVKEGVETISGKAIAYLLLMKTLD